MDRSAPSALYSVRSLFVLLLFLLGAWGSAQDALEPLSLAGAQTRAVQGSADVVNAARDLDAAQRGLARVEADPTSLRVPLLDARHAVAAAVDSLRNAEHAARSAAADAFEALLEAEFDVRVAEASLAIADIEAQAVRIRREAGAATVSDVARAEDAFRSAERQLRDSRDGRGLARDRLALRIDVEGELPPLVAEQPGDDAPTLEASLARLDEHAALASARRAVVRAEANLAATDVAFTTPQAQIEAARDALASARDRAEDLARTLELSVRQAFNAVTAAQGREASAEETLMTARDDLFVATTRFESGSIAEIDVLRAELTVLQAEASMSRATHALAASLRALEGAVLGAGQ